MGLKDFTTGRDDDQSPGSGPSAPGTPGGSLPPGLFGGPIVPGPGGPGAPADPEEAVKDLLIDYNARFATADPTLFRDVLIEQTLSVLIGQNKPNVLLKGAAGVGKTAIVEDIARRIATGDPLIPDQVRGYTIMELPITNVIAGSGLVGSLEEKVKQIVAFAANPRNKVILFLDEIHQITGGSSSHTDPSARKISQILKPALARGEIRVIGATTSTEARAFDDDPAFARRFTPVVVDELTVAQTEQVLTLVRPGLMQHYGYQITVSDQVVRDTVRIAEQNSRAAQHRPDNAITLLDRAMADRVLEQKRLIAQAERDGDTVLAQALQATPQVPLTTHRVLEVSKRLMTGNAQRPEVDVPALHASLSAQLQGQDDVLTTLADQLTRHTLGLFPSKKPLVWMFAGASGVGKTQAAKIIAQHVTGVPPIIVTMTEYQAQYSTASLLGSPPGYVGSDSTREGPFGSLESNPHRVLLLDEFEKGHRDVQRTFMQAFDEGFLRDAQGKLIDFSKAIIICTTNAAREVLDGRSVGFNTSATTLSQRSLNKALADFFDTELLGRFSLIVGFNPIGTGLYRQIAAAHYTRERDRILTDAPRLAAVLPDVIPASELEALVSATFVDAQGARPAERAVQRWIEDRVLAAQASAQSVLVTAQPTHGRGGSPAVRSSGGTVEVS